MAELRYSDWPEFTRSMHALADCFGARISDNRIEQYWEALKPYPWPVVRRAFNACRDYEERFPPVARVIGHCQANQPIRRQGAGYDPGPAEREAIAAFWRDFTRTFPLFGVAIWGKDGLGGHGLCTSDATRDQELTVEEFRARVPKYQEAAIMGREIDRKNAENERDVANFGRSSEEV
jgi:hypothetical protein